MSEPISSILHCYYSILYHYRLAVERGSHWIRTSQGRTFWRGYGEDRLRCIHQNKLTSRLYCITTDNASNNGTMRKELEDMLKDLEQDIPAWDSAGTTIPCMAHVIQLAVKAML